MAGTAQGSCRGPAWSLVRRFGALIGLAAALISPAAASGHRSAASGALPRTAEASAARTFIGATSQRAGRYGTQRLPGNRIAFSISGGMVRGFSVPWVATCPDFYEGGLLAPVLGRATLQTPIRLRRGAFAIRGLYLYAPGPRQSASVLLDVSGTVRGARATGVVSVSFDLDTPLSTVAICGTTRSIRWSAHETAVAPTLAYPGARPLVAEPPIAFVLYASVDPRTHLSTIESTGRGGPPASALFTPPRGASDSHPSASATASGTDVVAFERTFDGRSEIFSARGFLDMYSNDTPVLSMDAPPVQLTQFARSARDPAVSPDGNEIAFVVGSGGSCSLWLMNADGTEQRALTDNSSLRVCDAAPAWSPDGLLIAFTRTQPTASGAPLVSQWVILTGGGAPQALRLPPGVEGFGWAPGFEATGFTRASAGIDAPGSAPSDPGAPHDEIVYIRPGGPHTLPSLHMVRPDGTGDTLILRAPGLTGRPAWSPTDDAIALELRRTDGTSEIATVALAGGAPRDITETPRVSDSDPAWALPGRVSLALPASPASNLSVRSRPRRRRHR